MPNWQPNWTDVAFDYVEAYETISTCYGCIAFLESRHTSLDAARNLAVLEWRGPSRTEFDSEYARLERIATDLAEQLHAAIRSTRMEIAAAEAEQRLRVSDRLRWEAEAREEVAREEQARHQSTSCPFNRDGVMVLG